MGRGGEGAGPRLWGFSRSVVSGFEVSGLFGLGLQAFGCRCVPGLQFFVGPGLGILAFEAGNWNGSESELSASG